MEYISVKVYSILRMNQHNRSNCFSSFFRPKAREYVVWYNPLRLFRVAPGKISNPSNFRRCYLYPECKPRYLRGYIPVSVRKSPGKPLPIFSLHPYRVTLLLSLNFVSFFLLRCINLRELRKLLHFVGKKENKEKIVSRNSFEAD